VRLIDALSAVCDRTVFTTVQSSTVVTGTGASDNLVDRLDTLADQFETMADNAERLQGENEVAFAELFTEQFMRQHTDVSSFEQYLENSQWEVESQEEFEAIPKDEFDEYVTNHSEFDSWEAMLETA
jgi:hypothetical protein